VTTNTYDGVPIRNRFTVDNNIESKLILA